MLTIPNPDFSSPAWESLDSDLRHQVRTLLDAFREAPAPGNGRTEWFQQIADEFDKSKSWAINKFYALRNTGGDWTVLADGRKSAEIRAKKSLARNPAFVAELLTIVEKHQRKNAPAFRYLKRRWQARRSPIPGYMDYPGWPQIPAGWTDRNLSRIVSEETNKARMASIRIGTSSKTNQFLPTVLTTRVGLHPGQVIQIDDVWHDNMVTYGKSRKPVRVLELGALDLFSASRFHWGAMPRLRKSDEHGNETKGFSTIGGKEMRLFLAGLLHRTGYSPQGTSFMSEHATAKISQETAKLLYDATGGMVRVEYQPIEGKQAALSGYWNGTEGGNFRAKACLESTHNLMHNDLSFLEMQTGSPSSGLKGPVTTDRIVKYIEGILRDVAKKCPHRIEQLRLPTWDFHRDFVPFLIDYYAFGLDARTDHDLEGWGKLGHIVNEYTTAPGSGHFISEKQFLALPDTSRAIIAAAAQDDPQTWSRRRNLSPKEVWSRRPQFLPIPPTVLCDIIGADLAREATASKGFITFSDQEISADPLIFTARYCAGPRIGSNIPHGEKVRMFVMPFDDSTAIITDAKDRYLGQIPFYKRVQPLNTDAFGSDAPFEQRPDLRTEEFIRAAGEKHQRIAEIQEPSRHLHANTVQQARGIRAHNSDVLSGRIITPNEQAEADRHASAVSLVAADSIRHAKTPPQQPSSEDWTAPAKQTPSEAAPTVEQW